MKAVIVAAGYGTRFLPVTKTTPKELLPLFDKTCIDFLLDEFEEAGIRDVIVISSRRKKSLDDYFDREVELTDVLLRDGKTELAKVIAPRKMNFTFVHQQEMKGTGHALLITKSFVGKEPFVAAYPDDLVVSKPGLTKKMVELYEKHDKSVPPSRRKKNVSRYGVIEPEEKNGVTFMKRIVEKPAKGSEPSNFVPSAGICSSPNF
jgi:UTP--glucose-1-phosphate uridylyltransferase